MKVDVPLLPAMPPTGNFSFQFTAPKSRDDIPRRTITREPTLLDSLDPASDLDLSPIQHLPPEILTLIASYLSSPSLIIHLAWSCKSLYRSLGPTNRLFWYKILHRRRQIVSPSLKLPEYDVSENYYQRVLDIKCSRAEKPGCQRCLLYQDQIRPCTDSNKSSKGAKSVEEKDFQLLNIFTCKVYRGTWCWDCIRDVYESLAIVQLSTPLPEVPYGVLTELRVQPCGHRKPGYFISRSAVKEVLKEQCPNGKHTSFLEIPEIKGDIMEGRNWILDHVLGVYRRDYTHLHVLLTPLELGSEIRGCLKTTRVKPKEGMSVGEQIVDAVFGLARMYITTKDIEDEDKREKERIEGVRKFMVMFFGLPNTETVPKANITEVKEGVKDGKIPTTRFIAFLCKVYWLGKMEELGRDHGFTDKQKSSYCIQDKPRKRCGYCLNNEKKDDGSGGKYSPVMTVWHMITEHPDKLDEEWPDVIDPPKQKQNEKAKEWKDQDFEDLMILLGETDLEESSSPAIGDVEDSKNAPKEVYRYENVPACRYRLFI